MLPSFDQPNSLVPEILSDSWYHLGKWMEPALAAELWLDYGRYAQRFFDRQLDRKILYLNGDFFLSRHDSEIFQTEAYEAAKSGDNGFFQKIYTVIREVTTRLSERSQCITSVDDFLAEYAELPGVWMPLNNVALGIERYVQERDPSVFSVVKGYLDSKPLILQQVDEMRQLKEEIEQEIGQKVKSIEDIPLAFQAKLAAHLERYQWLGSHHFIINELTTEELVERMAQTPVDSPEIVGRNDEQTTYLVRLLDLIGYARFRAAEVSGYCTFFLRKHLVAVAEQKGLTYEEIVEHTVAEIRERKISQECAAQRKECVGFYFNGQEYLLAAREVGECRDRLLSVSPGTDTTIKGLPARKGRVSGRVKIVLSQAQMAGFEEGMVLVAHETTPDVVYAMQKSAAIVTDFGGLTSHAAILARELSKPCIVGTGRATLLLQDGDFVEVDADNGEVHLLEKAVRTS